MWHSLAKLKHLDVFSIADEGGYVWALGLGVNLVVLLARSNSVGSVK